jgi:hypothetical protein
MVNILELNGTRLKKDLNLRKVVKRWHNHNNSGGNFGINLYTGGQTDYEITGNHDLIGTVTTLRFAELYRAVGPEIISRRNNPETLTITYPELVLILKRLLGKLK